MLDIALASAALDGQNGGFGALPDHENTAVFACI
jgi:hypothetical protein